MTDVATALERDLESVNLLICATFAAVVAEAHTIERGVALAA